MADDVVITDPAYWADHVDDLLEALRHVASALDLRPSEPDEPPRLVTPSEADEQSRLRIPSGRDERSGALEEALRSVEEISDPVRVARPLDPDRLTMTVEEAAAALGISRALAYEAVNRHQIPTIRIGRRILVPRAALARLLDAT